MAVKRRRLFHAFVAAAIITLWWQYGPSARPTTRLSSVDEYHSKLDSEVGSGPTKVVNVKTKENPEHEGNTVPSKSREAYPLSTFMALPSGSPAIIPQIQFPFRRNDSEASQMQKRRLAAVEEAFIHSWTGYKKHAWLKDEVAPLTGGHRNTICGWAATLVDSLDTLWIMGLEKEFHQAVNAAATISFRTPASLPINVFETTIRLLGGFLGAYDVSGGNYPILLEKAREVGEMLYGAFDTPNRLPVTRWSKLDGEVASGDTLLAEIGSLSIEFTRLSQLTGDPKYFDAVQRITNHLSDQQMKTKLPGLFPIIVNAREADFTSTAIFTIGGMADSLYEYFPKQYLMLGGRLDQYKSLYENAFVAIKEFILFKPMTPTNEDIVLAGTVRAFNPPKLELDPQMQHLACFAGGMIALASKVFDCPADLEVAAQLTNGCLWAGRSTASGIMPELFHTVPCPNGLLETCRWNEDAWSDDMFRRNSNDHQTSDKSLPKEERMKLKQKRLRIPTAISAIASRQYFLRPEVIESIFVMYRITGDELWRDKAWLLFQSIANASRTEIAFAALEDVSSKHSRQTDRMESFWLAETLKYFYLIFSEPGVVSLDEYVFNTEAHPFKRPR